MSVTWVLKDAAGSNLSHQPASGSPLALKYDSSGYAHLSGYPGETICLVEGTADTSTVTIALTPDTAGDSVSSSLTRIAKVPSNHSGGHTWTDGSNGLLTLVFDVPTSSGPTHGWDFGVAEPPIALKVKIRIKR